MRVKRRVRADLVWIESILVEEEAILEEQVGFRNEEIWGEVEERRHLMMDGEHLESFSK